MTSHIARTRQVFAATMVKGLEHPNGQPFQVKPDTDPIWEQLDPRDGITNSMLMETETPVEAVVVNSRIVREFDIQSLTFDRLMLGSTELSELLADILRAAEVSRKVLHERLDKLVAGENNDRFEQEQIMDHLNDNLASPFLPWPYFVYAIKSLGGQRVKIVIE